jgi:hypothetical protein
VRGPRTDRGAARGPIGAVAGLILLWLVAAAVPVAAATLATDWRRIEPPGGEAPSAIHGVTDVGGRWVAVGSAGAPSQPAVWTSTDGSTWDRAGDVQPDTGGVMRDVIPGSPGYLAVGSVGDDGAMWSGLPDGESWRRVLVASFLGTRMNAIDATWAGTVVVGHDPDTGQAAIWRLDGDDWIRIPETPDFDGIELFGIATGSFSLLAVGEDVRDGSGAALISEDGVTWTRYEPAELDAVRFRDVMWGGNGFTIVGSRPDGGGRSPVVYTVGSDALQIQGVTDALASELAAVTFSGSGGIAVGGGVVGSAAIFESDGGAVWSRVQDPTGRFEAATMADVDRGGTTSDTLVIVGWSGSGTADAPDAAAAIWTTAAAGLARAYETVVPGPFDISTDPVVVATGLAVAAGTALLIPFPGALFNSTVEANAGEIGSWFAGIRRRLDRAWSRLRRGPPGERSAFWRRPLGIAAFLLLSAVIYALLDPSIGLDLRSLWVVLGLLAGLVVTSLIFAVPTAAYRWATARERPAIRVMPWTVLVAVGCVLLTRLTAFQPGYLYGLLIGVTFAAELSVRDEGRATAIASAWVLALTILAWFGLSVVRAWGDPDGGVTIVSTAALTTVVVAGFEGVVFGLLPLRFLPGAAIFAWSRRTWTVLFVVGFFGFLHVLVNPQSGYLADTARTPMLTVVLLFVFFGAVSVALWAYFRFRPGRPDPTAT